MYFCAANSRNCPQACKTVSAGRWPLGGDGQPAQQQQVLFARAGALADRSHGAGEVPVQPLDVVVDAQPALLAERLQFVALLPAQHAGPGNANGHQRQPLAGQARSGEQILDRVEGRDAQSGLSVP